MAISTARRLLVTRCEAATATPYQQGLAGLTFREMPHSLPELGPQHRHLMFSVEIRRTTYEERRAGLTRATTSALVLLYYRQRPAHADEPSTDYDLSLDAAETLMRAMCDGVSGDIDVHPVSIDPRGSLPDGSMVAVQIEVTINQAINA